MYTSTVGPSLNLQAAYVSTIGKVLFDLGNAFLLTVEKYKSNILLIICGIPNENLPFSKPS